MRKYEQLAEKAGPKAAEKAKSLLGENGEKKWEWPGTYEAFLETAEGDSAVLLLLKWYPWSNTYHMFRKKAKAYWDTYAKELKAEQGECELCCKRPPEVTLHVHHNGKCKCKGVPRNARYYYDEFHGHKLVTLVGREREFRRLMQVLCKYHHDLMHPQRGR